MRHAVLLLSLILAALGCANVPPAAGNTQGTEAVALPFIEDDYARALTEARSRGVPLFVEAWAPW